MPGRLQRNPLTGRVQRDKATGRVRRIGASSSICCCRGTCACGPDPVSSGLPDVIPVTISGVTIPTGCLLVAFFLSELAESVLSPRLSVGWSYDSVPINQKFCLQRVPGTCTWTAVVDATVNYYGSFTYENPGVHEGAPDTLCDCNAYYGGCARGVLTKLGVTLSVFETAAGASAILYAEVGTPVSLDPSTNTSVLPPDRVIFSIAVDPLHLELLPIIPCNGTLSISNQQTYYRTYFYWIEQTVEMPVPHEVILTDPGGVCRPATDIPCPTSPGTPFGGTALIDTRGTACP